MRTRARLGETESTSAHLIAELFGRRLLVGFDRSQPLAAVEVVEELNLLRVLARLVEEEAAGARHVVAEKDDAQPTQLGVAQTGELVLGDPRDEAEGFLVETGEDVGEEGEEDGEGLEDFEDAFLEELAEDLEEQRREAVFDGLRVDLELPSAAVYLLLEAKQVDEHEVAPHLVGMPFVCGKVFVDEGQVVHEGLDAEELGVADEGGFVVLEVEWPDLVFEVAHHSRGLEEVGEVGMDAVEQSGRLLLVGRLARAEQLERELEAALVDVLRKLAEEGDQEVVERSEEVELAV